MLLAESVDCSVEETNKLPVYFKPVLRLKDKLLVKLPVPMFRETRLLAFLLIPLSAKEDNTEPAMVIINAILTKLFIYKLKVFEQIYILKNKKFNYLSCFSSGFYILLILRISSIYQAN